MIDAILRGFIFPLELIAAILVFSHLLERRTHFLFRIAAGCLGILGISALLSLFINYVYGESTPVTYVAALIYPILICPALLCTSSLVIWFAYMVSFREALYCGACSYLMEHIAYCVRLILSELFPSVALEAGSVPYFISLSAVYVLFYYVFVRRMTHNGHFATDAVLPVNITVGVLAVAIGLSLFASLYGFEFLHAIYTIIFGIFVLYGQMAQQNELHLRMELDLQRKLAAQQKAQYEMSRENIELINHKCHDLKHQIAALKHIRDANKQNEVISSLEKSVIIYDSIYKTGNDILNTVLTEKSLLCSESGITLSCIADGSLLAFLDEVDAYTLLGNALDNAIEAVVKLPQEKRLIDFSLRETASMVILKLVNNYCGELTFREGLPKTSKDDEQYHGFGIKSIKNITERYDGIVKISTDGERFTLQITFPPQA